MRTLVTFLFLFTCVQLSALPGQKRALVICVSEQEDKSWAAINASNDLYYVDKLLESSGYDDICVLTGKNATKQGIIDAFVLLTNRCRQGDIVYIHFSGHGQLMTDVNGDEAAIRSKDRYDECWIPYDAYLEYGENDKGDKHLSDDEIGSLLTGIKKMIGATGRILVVVDACHSGGSTRSHGKDLYEDLTVRGIEDVFTIPHTTHRLTESFSEDWLTLSACMAHQVNAECVSPKVGKLTYILYLLRSQLDKLTNKELLELIGKMMNSAEYKAPLPQDPMLTGCTDEYEINVFF